MSPQEKLSALDAKGRLKKWLGENAMMAYIVMMVLREHVKDESVDLIYLDPPFNSDANYNVLFRSPTGQESDAQVEHRPARRRRCIEPLLMQNTI